MKSNYVYLVYCNKNPIVYGVYKNKTKAFEYTQTLIEYRFYKASQHNFKYGYYHNFINDDIKETNYDKKQKIIFSACLMIKDGLLESISDDGCYIKIERRIVE